MTIKKYLTPSFENNIWKLFIYHLSHRRHYIPILSIFFLSLPDTTAKQIGLYTGIGYLAGFLLEIPSGYFADKFGHKNTLILSKICMIISTLLFIFSYSFQGFLLGSLFLSISQAFHSGAASAFLYESLESLNKEDEYSKISGKISGRVSILSMILIILLPLFTVIDLAFPLKINLILDIIGLIALLMLISPSIHTSVKEKSSSIFKIIKDSYHLGLFPFAIFTGAILGFLLSEGAFRTPYLAELGYPIVLLGLVMGLSRLVWFFVGENIEFIEKRFTLPTMMFIEIFLFTGAYFMIALFSNPYVVGAIISLVVGYQWGRGPILTKFLLKNYIKDRRYKATVISLKAQITAVFSFSVTFLIGFVMEKSYKLGFMTLGIALFVILVISYLFFLKNFKLLENTKPF